jgi:hypothetical protein
LTDPSVAGIDYPAGNAAYGNCLYLNGTTAYCAVGNASLTIDPTDLRVEGWFKADAAVDGQMLFDRWNQIMIWSYATKLVVWVDGASNNVVYPAGVVPTDWTHFSVEVLGTEASVYINDELISTITMTNTLGTPSKTTTFVGMRYNSTQKFAGYIDDFRISKATAEDVVPDWAEPYIDEAGTVSALYHFDALADPNVVGNTDELLPDDDSDNPDRDADMFVYSGGTRLAVGESGGPALVDPVAEGIGYPLGDSSFGKCAKFDDPVLVEADTFRASHADVVLDSSNVAIECWVRPADDLLALPGDGTVYNYYIIDRWGEIDLKLMQLGDGSFQLQAMAWDAVPDPNQTVNYLTVGYDTLGLDPSNWAHVRFENYLGEAKLYINGSVAVSTTLPTTSLGTVIKTTTIIGARYNPKEYFWGYLDEMKISQAVYSVGCGAWGYADGDFDEDCEVGVSDLKLLAAQWLADVTTPSDVDGVDSGVYEDYATYNIPMASAIPTIDGTINAGEWADAKEVYLAMPELTTAPNVGGFKYEIPEHDDFSGYYYMKWDATNLYVGITITDEALIFDAGYPDDHATLAFNLNNMAGAVAADVAFYNMYRDYFGDSVVVNAGSFNQAFNPDNAVIASSTSATGWSFEAAFKWSDFGYTPTVGDVHGAAIMICDNDVADGLRDTFLFDSGSGDTGVLELPSLYRTVTLTSGIVCGDNGYLAEDLSADCFVNLLDYAMMADQWLACTTPGGDDCIDAR